MPVLRGEQDCARERRPGELEHDLHELFRRDVPVRAELRRPHISPWARLSLGVAAVGIVESPEAEVGAASDAARALEMTPSALAAALACIIPAAITLTAFVAACNAVVAVRSYGITGPRSRCVAPAARST